MAVLVLALGAAAVGAAASGSVPGDLTSFAALGDEDRPRSAPAADPPATPVAEPRAPVAIGPAAAAFRPPFYRVVEATRLRRAERERPEPPEQREKEGRSRLADRVEKAVAAPSIPEFGVAMINILGSQHTAGGKGGYASGTSRAATATRMLLGRGASIIGFSEIQTDQLNVFRNNAPGFGVYPGTSLGGGGVPQTVAWNTAVWSLVEATQIYIPFSGQVRPQPVVKLAHVETGAELWVMNVHNSPQGMEGERDRAEAVEIAKINELRATGVPVVVTGDFNEKQEVLCEVTAATGLNSAVGGGSCYPPPQPMRVDWIFASPELSLSSYAVTREAPVPSITDHAVLYSRLSLP